MADYAPTRPSPSGSSEQAGPEQRQGETGRPSSGPDARQRPGETGRRSQLTTPKGTTSIADAVVAKIAGLAAREVGGVHDMGRSAARAFGSLREMLPGPPDRPSPTRGVKVEVGERQAAVDLDLVMEYGVSIPAVAEAVRQNVIERVEGMAGLEVVEVNVDVDDIWLGEEEEADQQPPRVA
jgi:uncharacterized alkaline shock family protein YloU